MTTETTHEPRSVAITGAGSGLGREIAIGFADKGYRVFGTARTPEEIDDLRHRGPATGDAQFWPEVRVVAQGSST